MNSPFRHRLFLTNLFAIAVLALSLSGCGRKPAPSTPPQSKAPTTSELKDQLAQLKMDRDELLLRITRLKKKKTELKQKLKNELRAGGVTSSKDLKGNQTALFTAKLVKDYERDLKKIEQQLPFYDDNIVRLEHAVDSAERKQLTADAVLTDAEFRSLRKRYHELNEELGLSGDSREEMELNDLIDDVLSEEN